MFKLSSELPQFFFIGSSDQEKAANKLNTDVAGINPTVRNRYDTFKLPNTTGDMMAAADRSTKRGISSLKKQTATNVKTAAGDTAKGAQSRGYGGAILEDMIAKARSRTSGQGTNAMQDLLTKRGQMDPQLMQMGNQNAMQLLAGGQGVDLQNMNNLFQKYGLQGNIVGMLKDDTWFDDVLAIGNMASGFFGGGGGGGGEEQMISAAAAASDARLKEKLELVGTSPSGINIYNFNYIKNPGKRYQGVIAQELFGEHSCAVEKDEEGFYKVDYSKIDVEFKEV